MGLFWSCLAYIVPSVHTVKSEPLMRIHFHKGTFPDQTKSAEGLPHSGEGDSDPEHVDSAPGHLHHEAHHHEVLERRLRDLPRFLVTPKGKHGRSADAMRSGSRKILWPGHTNCVLGLLEQLHEGGIVLRHSGTVSIPASK
jgi:hypothetical protein